MALYISFTHTCAPWLPAIEPPLGTLLLRCRAYPDDILGDELRKVPSCVPGYYPVFTSVGPPPIAKQQVPLIPTSYAHCQNYPNPFNSQTTITSNLPGAEQVLLKVYNVLGEEVMTAAKGWCEAGTHVRSADYSGCASGVCLYRITAGTYTETKRMLLVNDYGLAHNRTLAMAVSIVAVFGSWVPTFAQGRSSRESRSTMERRGT